MNLKAPKTLAVLTAVVVVLLVGTVLISGCGRTGAAKTDESSQIIQASVYQDDCDKPCDAAKKETKTCPAKSNNPGCEAKSHSAECEKACCEAKKKAKTCPKMSGEKANPSECPMKSHSKTKDAEAHSTEHNKPCSK